MSNQEHLTPNPDFDWGMYEKGTTLSEAARKEQEAKYEETLNSLKVNEVVIGKVVEFVKNDKTIREVLVDVGYKSLGVVPYTEFRYNQDLKVGDEVEVYVISQEDRSGALVLSHRQARLERAWERINEAQEKDEVILGFIKSRTKGGMIVDVFGVEAFLPGSQIDVRPIRDYDALIDKTMEFKIVKINQEQKNVVVSHKILVEAELEQQKRDIISKLEKGQVLEGTVKNILPFGVFVDLGGVDGLIHITDLSWERVSHPSEVVELDQKINVVILDFDENKTRIALGLKQLTPNPWDNLDPNLKPGDVLKGKVELITDYGAFVEIAPGIEG
ncbi:30S ribosomal protein S1, partial [Porphyromonas endodontalis]